MRKLGWIGTAAFQVLDGDRELVFDLAENQTLPPDFKEGDEVTVVNRPAIPPEIVMGRNTGYYEVTHVPTGKTIHIAHSTSEWRFK